MSRISRQIDIEIEQEERLPCLAEALKIDGEELIRQAIDLFLALHVAQIDLDVWKQEMVFITERRVGAIVQQARSWQRQDLYAR
ncbi:MAG: hypothetical protein KDE56_03990 [Anaerolineales bacterium]|nr:hypothetical protein [Anaerolineales bacterium]